MQANNTTTIIYHRSDPDGWFSNTVCRKFLPSDTVSIGWDYSDPVPKLPAEGDIYMVDISVDTILDGRSDVNRDRVIWIDHHKTAIDRWNKLNIRGLRIEGVAACRLCWKWFHPATWSEEPELKFIDWSQRQPGEPEALFLVGLRDVWKHDGTAHKQTCNHLNLALVAYRDNERLRYCLIDGGDHSVALDDEEILTNLLRDGAAIERYADNLNKEHAERGAMVRHWRGLDWMILNSQARGSKVLSDHAWPVPVDALMVWAVGGDGQVNLSLYHAPGRTDLDLSVIAKEHGGGGHPGACGFRTNLTIIHNIICTQD